MRRLIALDCKDLLIDSQKFNFSADGKLLAAGSKDGTRIYVLELILDSKKSLHDLILLCICYRGFFSSHLKLM